MKPLGQVLGENVTRLREEMHLDRAGLAKLVEERELTVYRWETAATWPNADQLHRLATALGTSAAALLTPPKPQKEKAKPREDPRLREALTVICRTLGYRLVSVGRKT